MLELKDLTQTQVQAMFPDRVVEHGADALAVVEFKGTGVGSDLFAQGEQGILYNFFAQGHVVNKDGLACRYNWGCWKIVKKASFGTVTNE
jgi:hypothetical protein